ncbi:MAG TPA: exodeoxyribonuclease VII small subunit [Saprospiraceae bacterium]|nr:exodeoxyribonuclease VII small subunit [Saprospiraceae bacterium]HNT20700.1 exodeoxyribonuclease VII small subunit [Saprospiraceae bacterium]
MSKTRKDKGSFEEAKRALDEIIAELQNENTSIDKLASQVKRAQELIQYCQSRLRTIEKEVHSLLDEEE